MFSISKSELNAVKGGLFSEGISDTTYQPLKLSNLLTCYLAHTCTECIPKSNMKTKILSVRTFKTLQYSVAVG